ncbi:hypothetical protein NGRA_2030 [Nosema granulosis]|uniref:Uncharacterized protein n=1 Tax=Nosema granulosis TaxID=83296 RepID=A0A9P6GYE3_9MICR|nr:hypothetical protein NGRA_2030 [Nosema granulosis]
MKAVDAYVRITPPCDISEIARIFQAAQTCYQKATEKEKKKSEWRENIKKKVQELHNKGKLLEKVKKFETLLEEEKRSAKKIMREMGLMMSDNGDLNKAMVLFNEKKELYSKKLEVADKRKEYRCQNQTFELYRSIFYRSLKETREVEYSVPKESIKAFWGAMWDQKEELSETKAYDEYLSNFLPGTDEQTPFPSFTEFLDIINGLPNLEAAGCDGIFNFFIKKCESLYPYLYEAIKKICVEGDTAEQWFYKGLTYLFPKGNPTTGGDFRPITCMTNLYKLTTKCTTRVLQPIVEHRGLLA